MKRRQFVFSAATLVLLGGCGVLPNLGKPATPRVPRVGLLASEETATEIAYIAGLKQGLAELRYVDGHTIVFELRDANSNFELLPDLTNELIRLPVDVIVSLSSPATLAARQATTVIPIVFVGPTDPVDQGIVASLARPGGNLTGVTGVPPTSYQKELQILAQLVPKLSRVAIVADFSLSNQASNASKLQATTIAANTMSVQLKTLDVRSAEDVEPALAQALAWQAQAMLQFGTPGAVADAVPRLVDFELQNRIPVTVTIKSQVQAGGLLAYASSDTGAGRTAATLVDKIIKGARPADLPVEQPSIYELVVNQTTAQALGLTIPPEVAQQVTDWVQ